VEVGDGDDVPGVFGDDVHGEDVDFAGMATSILRVASAGTSCTAIVRASTVPSFLMMCTWSPPGSTNPSPTLYTLGVQLGSSPSYAVTVPAVTTMRLC
jgi:hypothetical protein